MSKNKLDKFDFRNYVHDIHDIDCATSSGWVEYTDWLENLICDPDKFKEVLEYLLKKL